MSNYYNDNSVKIIEFGDIVSHPDFKNLFVINKILYTYTYRTIREMHLNDLRDISDKIKIYNDGIADYYGVEDVLFSMESSCTCIEETYKIEYVGSVFDNKENISLSDWIV